MADIFGVEKDNSSTGVLSFQNVVLSIDKDIRLCQSANLNYQRQITPVMAVGITTVFLSPQPGQGTLQITRAIGSEETLGSDLQLDSTGCEIKDFTLTASAGDCEAGSGTVSGQGMMSGYSFNINVGGGVSVTEGATLTVIDVSAG